MFLNARNRMRGCRERSMNPVCVIFSPSKYRYFQTKDKFSMRVKLECLCWRKILK